MSYAYKKILEKGMLCRGASSLFRRTSGLGSSHARRFGTNLGNNSKPSNDLSSKWLFLSVLCTINVTSIAYCLVFNTLIDLLNKQPLTNIDQNVYRSGLKRLNSR